MAIQSRLSTNRYAIRDQVARYRLATFILLAYTISALGWILSERIDLGVVNGFGVVFSAGPALAAVIVAALLRSQPSGVPAAKHWRLFGIAGVLALAVMTVRRLWITPEWAMVAGQVTTTAAYPSLMAFVVDVLAAAAVAVCVAGVYSPRQGVRDLLCSFDLRTVPVRWYWWVIALGLYPVVIALGNLIAARLGLPVLAPAIAGPWYELALDALLTCLLFLFLGGGLEEPGWRGFALPYLQQRYSPLRSSLILATVWTLWHWPYFWSADLLSGLFGLLFYGLLEVAPLTFLFTAVFNRAGGSLPVVILLHASVNTTAVFLTPTSLAQGLWFLVCLGAALWMWRSPQVKQYAGRRRKDSDAH